MTMAERSAFTSLVFIILWKLKVLKLGGIYKCLFFYLAVSDNSGLTFY